MEGEDDQESRFQLNEAAEFVRRAKDREESPLPIKTLELERGSLVFREGQMGDAMFIVQEGEVDILKRLEDGTSRILRTMVKGDFFGEMALIDRKLRSATAICRTQVRLVRVPQESLVRFIEGNPQFVMRMLNTFVERLRSANSIIEKAMDRHPTAVVLDGIQDYLRTKEQGSSGPFFDVAEFAIWANYRLGIPESRVPGLLTILQTDHHLVEGPLPGTYRLASPR